MGEAAGVLEGEAAGKALHSDAFQREVDAKATGWSRQGVSGVPFFVVHPASGNGQPVAFSGAQPSESRSSARRRKAYLRGRVSDTSRTRVVDMSGEEADGARQPHLEVAQRRVLKGGRHAGAEGGRGALLLARPLDGESHRRLEPAVIRQPQGGKSVLCGVFRAPRE